MLLDCKCWVEQRELWQGFGPPTPSMTGHAETLHSAADGSVRLDLMGQWETLQRVRIGWCHRGRDEGECLPPL